MPKHINWKSAQALIDRHSSPIIEALRDLERSLVGFCQDLVQHNLAKPESVPIQPVRTWRPLSTGAYPSEPFTSGFTEQTTKGALQNVVDAIERIRYEPGQAVNAAHHCFGVVGVPVSVIEKIRRINTLKDLLKEQLSVVSNLQVHRPGSSKKVDQLSTVILSQFGESNVNLLTAFRHIPFVDAPVHSIRFMQTNPRSVSSVSVSDLTAKAQEKGLSEQIEILSNLKDDYLAAPRPRYWRMKAKIFLQETQEDSKARVNRIVSADLPIFFPMLRKNSPWPDVKPPSPPNPRNSRPGRLASEPLLTIGKQDYFQYLN